MTQQLNASLSCPPSFVRSIIRSYLKLRHTRSKLLGRVFERFPNTNDSTGDAHCPFEFEEVEPSKRFGKNDLEKQTIWSRKQPSRRNFFFISYHHCAEFLFFLILHSFMSLKIWYHQKTNSVFLFFYLLYTKPLKPKWCNCIWNYTIVAFTASNLNANLYMRK